MGSSRSSSSNSEKAIGWWPFIEAMQRTAASPLLEAPSHV